MPDATTLLERTCRGERGHRVPVWIMRQAGRYLPEYRALRERVDFATAVRTPEVAAEITMQPMRRFDLDAAIIFADIMTPLEAMGVSLRFAPGPVLDAPLRSAADVDSVRPLDPESGVPHVLETLRLVRGELSRERALVGFAGAPFTLFCYLVEGGGSKDFMVARAFLRKEANAAAELLRRLGSAMTAYLIAQSRAGADVLMLFDSWARLLGPDTYRRYALPVVRDMVREIRRATGRPVVYYAPVGESTLPVVGEADADVLGLDWTVPLSRAAVVLGPEAVLQGNLDPAALFAPEDEVRGAVDAVLQEGAAARAHVFNLGHGIHRSTPPDRVALLVDQARTRMARAAAS